MWQFKTIFKYGTAKNKFSNLNTDLILKNNIKLKLQKILKLKLSFKKKTFSFLQTTIKSCFSAHINSFQNKQWKLNLINSKFVFKSKNWYQILGFGVKI